MTPGILSTLIQQSQRLLAPSQMLHQLAIANTEKLIALQVASLKSYADLSMAQWKAAARVNDHPVSFLDYVIKQGEHMTKVGEQLLSDAKSVSQLGVDCMFEVQKTVLENVASGPEVATEAGKAVTRKAA